MKLTGYDITLEPTGLHRISLDCIGSDGEIATIKKAYANDTDIYQLISLTGPGKKENKTISKVTFSAEQVAWDEGYDKGWNQRGKLDEIAYGRSALRIKKVIFNDPATIVFWGDGTKTVAKAHGDDKFDKEVGLTVCIAKKALGNRSNFDKVFKKWIKED